MTTVGSSSRAGSGSFSEWWSGLHARHVCGPRNGGHGAHPADKALADSVFTTGMRVPKRRWGDLLLGLLVAVALHGALCCCGWLFPPNKPESADTIVAAMQPADPLVVVGPEPSPAPAAPPELVEYAPADGEASAVSTIVPLELFHAEAGTITLQHARLSLALAGGNGGFRIDGGALRETGRGIRVAVFALADLDQAPVVLAQPLPQYPPALLRTAANGEVTVAFVVDADGVVRAARITAATHPEFEAPALQAVARWRFRPGRKNGRAVATRVEAPIAFSVPGRS